MSKKRSRIHAVVILIACVALFSGPRSTASELPNQAPSSAATGTIELIDQTDWVTAGSTFNMALGVQTANPPEQTEIVVTVFNAVPNRSSFNQTLTDRLSGTSMILERYPLNEVLGPDGTTQITLPVQDNSQRRFSLRDAGVYPVRVELRETGSDQVIDHFVTHLINEPSSVTSARMGVGLILPVLSPMTTGPEDRSIDPTALPDDGKSVADLAQILANHPQVPVTIAPRAETIERLSESESERAVAARQALIDARNNRPVLKSTWVPVVPTLYETRMSGELDRQFARAAATVDPSFPNSDEATWFSWSPLDIGALGHLQSRGFRRLIVPENQLAPTPRDTTLARPFNLSAGRGKTNIPAVQADSGLSSHFSASNGPALSAHRLLADLAVIWHDRPGQSRAVVAAPPSNWVANAQFVDILLRGLSSSPVVTPINLDQVFATPMEPGSGRSGLVRQLATLPKTQTANFPSERVEALRKQVEGLSSMSLTDDSVVTDLERRLLTTASAILTNEQRNDSLSGLVDRLEKRVGQVKIPAERSIRLTSQRGEIPISIQNDTGAPMRVVIRLTSDKLTFPDGDTRIVTIERRNATERFSVEARTSGAFPVQVQLASPDGSVVLVDSKITVRSSATSAVGVILTFGALGVLLLWWLRSALATRRKRQQARAKAATS